MKEEHYAHLAAFFAAHSRLKGLLCHLCALLPPVVMAAYPALLLFCLFAQGSIPWLQIICPALTLAGTVILRRLYPCPRPFEVFSFAPLIPHRSGGSFPSRHSASALAIALSAFTVHPAAGILLTALALLIGATRILTGLHFPRDVLSGYALALLIGIPGFIFL